MRDLLNLHIRALTEREDHPDTTQDLGTFVVWLLERHGYTVVMPPIKWKGTQVGVSKGSSQSGVDVRALRQEGDEVVLYRLVLKTGNMTRQQFNGSDGTMSGDLGLAAELPYSTDANFTGGLVSWSRAVVVAVHNGDVMGDELQGQATSLVARLKKNHGVGVEWWDATKLLELALDPPAAIASAADEDMALFPPERRPFLRILLDSLSTQPDGSAFKLSDVERMLGQVFKIEPSDYASTSQRHFTLRVTELGLYASMLHDRAQRDAGGNALPILDTLELSLSRVAAECVERSIEPAQDKLREALGGMLELYIQTAEGFARRLAPLLKHRDGLAIASLSEVVDYPLRVLRFSGYLAVAAVVLLDRSEGERARALAEALRELWRQNPGGALMPVADDQIIELALVWEVWLRLKMDAAVIESCTELLERLQLRAEWRLPLPLLWCRTGPEMKGEALDALAKVYQEQRQEGLSQQGSLIVPLALYLLKRLRPTEPLPGLKLPMVGQVWQPEPDAPQRWYAEDLSRTGTSHLVEVPVLERRVGEVAVKLAESPAERWKLPALDRVAWKVHRNPPPLWGFIELTKR